ncbi:MAG: tetratricopeptide repeat protein [Anaerolineae bacterium]|nr:tetratricopeptide repeat protein [Anaerolineae bacterium]
MQLAITELAFRTDIYGYDAAAWASYKNGQLDQAEVWISEALKLGTQDAKLYFHAGMIALGQGQVEIAREHLNQALAINPHFDPLQARIAQENLTHSSEVASP